MPRAAGASILEMDPSALLETVDERQRVEETFDALVERYQSQPSDEEALGNLMEIMNDAFDNGDVDFLMRSAMLMAAMSCTDPHMEELADNASSLLDRMNEKSSHGHSHSHGGEHGSKSRKKKNGKPVSQSIFQLLWTYGKK